MRSLVPADSLVYLETNDLAGALQPIIDSKPFNEVAKSKPDFSALKGVQLAVAVTGFETSEEKVNDEQSIGRIQPRFVAIADTHAWNFQAVGFAEQKLGSFVTKIYDSEPTLERSEKNGGKYFTWTASDKRKAYALVIDSLIYFGNDESAIDKCLAVKRGEADSIVKKGKVQSASQETLASGYVSTDGIAQIANIVGLKFASEAAEDSEIQSAIAGIVPQLIRNSITEVSWTAIKTEQGIEDKYFISIPPDVASVLNETFTIGDDSESAKYLNNTMVAQLPGDTAVATRYHLKNPQVAWRAILLVAQKGLDAIGGRIMFEFSSLLFEPYDIRDPEMFLSSLGANGQKSRDIITAKLDAQSEYNIVIAANGGSQIALKALSPDLKPPKPIIEGGLNIWSTEESDVQVAFDQDMIKICSKDDLPKINGMRLGELSDIRSESLRQLAISTAPITTVGQVDTSTLQIVEMLASEGRGEIQRPSTYFTETRFTKTGIERRTVSDFGLIGSIIAQVAQD